MTSLVRKKNDVMRWRMLLTFVCGQVSRLRVSTSRAMSTMTTMTHHLNTMTHHVTSMTHHVHTAVRLGGPHTTRSTWPTTQRTVSHYYSLLALLRLLLLQLTDVAGLILVLKLWAKTFASKPRRLVTGLEWCWDQRPWSWDQRRRQDATLNLLLGPSYVIGQAVIFLPCGFFLLSSSSSSFLFLA